MSWWPLVQSNRALCFATLLVSASHMARQQTGQANGLHIARLKDQVLSTMQQDFSDPQQCSGEGFAGAILTLAACEFLYGDKPAYSIHMAAAVQLIDSLGGTRSMSSTSALRNIACYVGHDLALIAGLSPFFEPSRPPSIPFSNELPHRSSWPRGIGLLISGSAFIPNTLNALVPLTRFRGYDSRDARDDEDDKFALMNSELKLANWRPCG